MAFHMGVKAVSVPRAPPRTKLLRDLDILILDEPPPFADVAVEQRAHLVAGAPADVGRARQHLVDGADAQRPPSRVRMPAALRCLVIDVTPSGKT